MFSSKSFVLGLRFRRLIHFEFIVYMVLGEGLSSSFPWGGPAFPAPFVAKTILPAEWSWGPCQNHPATCAWVGSPSGLLVYVSALGLTPHGFGLCGFIVRFELVKITFSTSPLLSLPREICIHLASSEAMQTQHMGLLCKDTGLPRPVPTSDLSPWQPQLCTAEAASVTGHVVPSSRPASRDTAVCPVLSWPLTTPLHTRVL